MSDFNPGDTLRITTASYKRRAFTVVESNGHRTTLRGGRGSHRVLVASSETYSVEVDGKTLNYTATTDSDDGYSIHEDDGEKNRGRPCTVDEVECGAVSAGIHAGHERTTAGPPPARDLARALGIPDDAGWERALREVGILRRRKAHRPITAMELAMLMQCETPREVAEWVIQRDVTQACVTGDQHAADNGAAMKLYLSSLELRRLSGEASE